ncbi:hypothetical protein GW17_00053154 [Ensete ventricosum]|nr:hypothetical protein GW17_00053154 [Ensete ventricosum]RZS23815.1 hypothetical protein BHM03_00056798 [Ensete ventricosum]
MVLISFVKRARYEPRGSSSFCLIPGRDAMIGFGSALERKLASNSLASWSKEWIKAGGRRLYHPRTIPREAVRKEGGRPRQGPLQRWLATARPPAGAASHGLVIRKGAAGCGQGQSAREADGARKGRQMPAAYRRPTAGVAARRGDACGQKHRPQGLLPTISRGSVIGLQ